MRFLKYLLIISFIQLLSGICAADSIRISQVDSQDLLLKQEITLYLSVTDDKGVPLTTLQQDNFQVLESPDGKSYKPVDEILHFQSGIDHVGGVSFLLLIDNSESMYWTIEGEKNSKEELRRISIAKKAVTSFLRSISNPNDKVGIASYNSYYTLLAKASSEIGEVEKQLATIKRPEGDEIYTELYASLNLAVEEFDMTRGRKAVIILSDGIDNPVYNNTKHVNKQFGSKKTSYQKPLQLLQLEGIPLYVIYFGAKSDQKDRHLKTIASQSGGVTFDAHNQAQLSDVYTRIMDQIQKEYVVSYRATMDAADRKRVRVTYQDGSKKKSVSRYYLSSSVFGRPSASFHPILLITVVISFVLLWLLSKIKFEKQRPQPSIEVLNAGAGKLSTQILTLGKEETIIGSSPKADMTIAGLPSVGENHATIVFDSAKNKYLLKGEGKMLVNNQPVVTKILEPGDLINIDGATIVFDEGAGKDKG